MTRVLAVPLVLLLLPIVLAGCMGVPAPAGEEAPQADVEEQDEAKQGEPRGGSLAKTSVDDLVGWPEVTEAPVRPGVRLKDYHTQGTLCTANFVFRSPDNASLYLGTASHCLPREPVGATVPIGTTGATATVWYKSFAAMAKHGTEGGWSEVNNDFALLRIDDAHRHLVHPAMLHYGGPTALADPANVKRGDGVLLHGNSNVWGDDPERHRHEGCVFHAGARHSQVNLVTPAVQGDSGSPAILATGEALGILTHVGPTLEGPHPATNSITNLASALQYAREKAGIEVELATWPLLAPPLLPRIPC